MDERTNERRPVSAKVAGIRDLAKSEAYQKEAADRRQHETDASEAQQALIDALKIAGFKVAPSMHSLLGASVGIDCTVETARELAAWIRGNAPARKQQGT